MDNDVIISQFDDIEEKVDFLIELCKSLETTNSELQSKIEALEHELHTKSEVENHHSEQKALIRSKMDNIMSKLDNFTDFS